VCVQCVFSVRSLCSRSATMRAGGGPNSRILSPVPDAMVRGLSSLTPTTRFGSSVPAGIVDAQMLGSVVVARRESPIRSGADVAGSFGVLAAGHPCDPVELRGVADSRYAAKRLPALLEGPSTTRGHNS
jgi:hypothetical protein